MTTALAKADPAAALAPLEQVIQLLGTWTEVGPVVDLMSQAAALKQLLRDQEASLEAQQKAGEIHLRAQRRAGELLQEQAERGERAAREDNLRRAPKAQPEPSGAAAPAQPPRPTLEELGIERNKAQRWQTLAKVPAKKFEDYIEAAKANGAEITTAGAMNAASRRNPHAASNVNNAEPDKNDRFTEREWVEALKKEFNLNWDFAGHELAPATEVFGRDRVWTIDDDCFRQDWSGKRGLLNPPWDELPRFVVFAWLKVATGECPLVVLPLPGTRWEQDWAQEFVHVFRPDEGGSGAVLRFPRRRKGYGTILDPEGKRPDNNVGLPSAELIICGPFTRSSRLQPALTIEEVIAAQRFGEDRGLAHLWKQALAVARGGWSGGAKHARALVAAVPSETSGAPTGAPATDPMPTASRTARGVDPAALQAQDRRALARVGINALVDEATGYQDVRPPGELRRMLAKERKGVTVAARRSTVLELGRFRGEATDLGFATRTPRPTLLVARCGARGCKEELRFPVADGGGVGQSRLVELRKHARSHVGKPAKKTSKKRGGGR